MAILCTLAGHQAETAHHHNQGLDFAICHHCGCDLIRAEGTDWTEVPRGFRVVWREFGRAGDAASVAERMERMAPPPRRRDPRGSRAKPRRDKRGKPFAGAAAILGTLANLGELLRGDCADVRDTIDENGQYVILLPGGGKQGAAR